MWVFTRRLAAIIWSALIMQRAAICHIGSRVTPLYGSWKWSEGKWTMHWWCMVNGASSYSWFLRQAKFVVLSLPSQFSHTTLSSTSSLAETLNFISTFLFQFINLFIHADDLCFPIQDRECRHAHWQSVDSQLWQSLTSWLAVYPGHQPISL